MSDTKKIGIFGAGGHAKVVADAILRAQEYALHAFYDDNTSRHGAIHYADRPVAGDRQQLLRDLSNGTLQAAFVALGNGRVRAEIGEEILRAGHTLATIIDPTAILSQSVKISPGTLVVAGAIINADTRIGPHVIINTGASVDHDCVIGAGVHIAPHATLCGGVHVGESSFIGAGATLIPLTQFPAHSTLGAGSTLTKSVDTLGTWVGSPVRILRSHSES